MTGLTRGIAGTDDDVDVPVEQRDEPDEPLGGVPAQLVVPEVGNVRLRDAETFRDRSLVESMLVDQLVQSNRELHTEFSIFRIGYPQIPE